jgi:hypothetical protein
MFRNVINHRCTLRTRRRNKKAERLSLLGSVVVSAQFSNLQSQRAPSTTTGLKSSQARCSPTNRINQRTLFGQRAHPFIKLLMSICRGLPKVRRAPPRRRRHFASTLYP